MNRIARFRQGALCEIEPIARFATVACLDSAKSLFGYDSNATSVQLSLDMAFSITNHRRLSASIDGPWNRPYRNLALSS